jgi:WD40 repeat protein
MHKHFCMGASVLILTSALCAWALENCQAQAITQRTPFAATAAFSPDGKWLATGEAWVDSPGVVKLRDLTTGKERLICKDHSDAVVGLAFTSDGKTLASGDWKGSVKLWDTSTRKELAAFLREGAARFLAFSPDGKLFACGSPLRRLIVWDLTTKKKASLLQDRDEYCVSFSTDGRTLACGGDSVMLWDVAAEKEHAVCASHNRPVVAIAFAPDSQTLTTADIDGTLCLWKVATGRLQFTLNRLRGLPTSVTYSPDGRMLASACIWNKTIRNPGGKLVELEGTEIKVWEVATGKERLTLDHGETGTSFQPKCYLQFSNDGKSLMSTVNRPGAAVKNWDLAMLAVSQK